MPASVDEASTAVTASGVDANWRRVKLLSLAALVVTFALTAMVLRLEGRIWFCECGEPLPWVSDPQCEHTSQHLLDPYSLSHLQHGLVFYLVLVWLWPDRPAADGSRPVRRRVTRFWLAVLIECAWEILENSPLVINRYREATAALGYAGDSVWKSLGDVLSCVMGYVLADWLGWRRTLGLFVAIEVGMILWIRDSLLLNVLMLVYPLDAIKAWQTAG